MSDLFERYVDPVQLRVRSRLLDELVIRILILESSPHPLVDGELDEQLLLLTSRMQRVVGNLQLEKQAMRQRLENLSRLYAQVDDEHSKQNLLVDYLIETVDTPKELRRDLKALDRYLDFDALRERAQAEAYGHSVLIEVAIGFVANAAVAVADQMPADSDTLSFLLQWAQDGERWQVQLAAVRGLRDTLRVAPQLSDDSVLMGLEEIGRNRNLHAWIQAAAIEALLASEKEEDATLALVAERLGQPGAGTRDMYVRALVSCQLQSYLSSEITCELLSSVLEDDPSEHVRMEVARVARELPLAEVLSLLARATSAAESSEKVRARAIESVSVAIRRSSFAKETFEAAVRLVLATLGDESSFVVSVACEELVNIASIIPEARSYSRQWLSYLSAVVASDSAKPATVEAAAAAAEQLEHTMDDTRRSLLGVLAEIEGKIEVGGKASLALGDLDEAVAKLCRSPEDLGRALALLSRESWGMAAQVTGNRLKLWRGDHFRRRLWRVLHEIRHPAPNKRQGYLHTVGRKQRGDVRAHPQKLDEATATTIPGERVHVDAEGDWGRQLPTVDDILDLPVFRPRPVRIFSSHGVTTLRAPDSIWQRLRNWRHISWRYARYSGLRQASLISREPRERGKYVRTLHEQLGVEVTYEPHQHGDEAGESTTIRALMPREEQHKKTVTLGGFAGFPAFVPVPDAIDSVRDWYSVNSYYFLSLRENSQEALAAFVATALTFFVGRAYVVRRRINAIRKNVPLSIGGWGTRGKSGTERIKAGLLGGLGFDVFVKTTGCEAMFLHSAAGRTPMEIFIFRAYGKASIWEQFDMLSLASRLGAEVFLWECMALNPRYVKLLQHDWMRDDLVTLTNAYPDHEDVQGPAGIDVAKTISQFIPPRSTVISSEINFISLFSEVCKQRKTKLIPVTDRDAEFIANDVLDSFPYQEHPRNIALVARMGEELGLEPSFSIATMASNVLADLGVLMAYPPVLVRGRRLRFVNCCSANERTGLTNSWQRMGLDDLPPDQFPDQMVVGVVNNRGDRISRSEVFSRIMVNDVACDRFYVIGTNQEGLRGYLESALSDRLGELELVAKDDLADEARKALPRQRLAREMTKLRVAPATAPAALARLEFYAKGAGIALDTAQSEALREKLEGLFGETWNDVTQAIARLEKDKTLVSLLEDGLAPRLEVVGSEELQNLETIEPPGRTDVVRGFLAELARMCLRKTLERQLEDVLSGQGAIESFATQASELLRSLFWANVIFLEDPGMSGDQIVDACASSLPPGVNASLVGMQNIKGTGLDFVYRWVALDSTVSSLERLSSERAEDRSAALEQLETFGDYGVVDVGLACAALSRDAQVDIDAAEKSRRAMVRGELEKLRQKKRGALAQTNKASGKMARVANWVEGWIDYLDGASRFRHSRRIANDLVAKRISYARAQQEMRAIVARQKGGWLAKRLASKG